MGLFRKREEIPRYEADWPEEYGYEEPITEEQRERINGFSMMQGRLRIVLMCVSAYLLFVGVGAAVTTYQSASDGTNTKDAQQIGLQDWQDRSNYKTLKSEFQTVQMTWQQDGTITNDLAQAAQNKATSYVPMQMSFNKVSDSLATQIRYTSTINVDKNLQPFVDQMVQVEKDMQQYNQLMSTACQNGDSATVQQGFATGKQVQQELAQYEANLNGLADTLHIDH